MKNWLDKMERRFGRYAIRNLTMYLLAGYAIGYLLSFTMPQLLTYFTLEPALILKGQVWRLLSWVIIPPNDNIIFVIFMMLLYYSLGNTLESYWGAFRYNVYIFSGILFTVIGAFIVNGLIGGITGFGSLYSTYYINMSIFLAFAVMYPDMQVMLYFIIPIKIKWMAILDAVIFGITIVFGYLVPFLPRNVWYSLYAAGFLAPSAIMCYANATAALVSMLNFIIFFFLYKKGPAKSSTQRNFDKAMRTAKKAQQNARKDYWQQNSCNTQGNGGTYGTASSDNRTQQSQAQHAKRGVPKHRCAVCGRTELDDENLTFRFCSKCVGNYEYCSDHLYTHIHVTGDKQ